MAHIKNPWNRKPPKGTRIDKSHPHARGLVFLEMWTNTAHFQHQDYNDGDYVTRDQAQSIEGSVDVVSSGSQYNGYFVADEDTLPRDGFVWRSRQTSGSSSSEIGWTYGLTPELDGASQITMMARFRPRSTYQDTGGGRMLSKRDSGGSSDDYALYLQSTEEFRGRINGDNIRVPAKVDFGEWYDGWCRYDGGVSGGWAEAGWRGLTGADQHLIDTQVGISLGATLNSSTDPLTVGYRYNSDRVFNGHIAWVAIWDRTLSQEEILAFSNNPYQIFEPQLIVTPEAAAAVPLSLEPDVVSLAITETRQNTAFDYYTGLDSLVISDLKSDVETGADLFVNPVVTSLSITEIRQKASFDFHAGIDSTSIVETRENVGFNYQATFDLLSLTEPRQNVGKDVHAGVDTLLTTESRQNVAAVVKANYDTLTVTPTDALTGWNLKVQLDSLAITKPRHNTAFDYQVGKDSLTVTADTAFVGASIEASAQALTITEYGASFQWGLHASYDMLTLTTPTHTIGYGSEVSAGRQDFTITEPRAYVGINHGPSVDVLQLLVPSANVILGFTTVSLDRLVEVSSESRASILAAESRGLQIFAESRGLQISAEDRDLTITSEDRTHRVRGD